MTIQVFPHIEGVEFTETRDALHGYAQVLGDWLKSSRPRRKHWWHASLRPSLRGLTTGVVHAGVDFELELDLRESQLRAESSNGGSFVEPLGGQPVAKLARSIEAFLKAEGLDERLIPDSRPATEGAEPFPGYSADHARWLANVFNSTSSVMAEFRAGIPEETSPIQAWPHHFDMSMLWLPGRKIPGQDPDNEEYSDKQMNFGFTFGDDGISEPYYYVTAYPELEAFPTLPLPVGTAWHTEGFRGVVLPYRSLVENSDPGAYLLDLWNGLLNAGRLDMLRNANSGDAG